MNLPKITDYIIHHEGLRLFAYKDTKGIWTMAVGYNLERTGALLDLSKHGINFSTIWDACQHPIIVHGVTRTAHDVITEEQARSLLVNDINASISALSKSVKGFDGMPDDAQMVLIDMYFNVGGSFLGWKHTIGFFEAHDWKSAAHELSVSKPWCTQVPVRCAENVAVLNSIV